MAGGPPQGVRRAPCWPSPTTGTSSTTSPSGSSSSTAARRTRTRATTRPTSRPSSRGSSSRASRTPSGPRSSSASWSGCAPTRRPGRPRTKARLARYEEMAAEAERNRKLDFEEINIPAGPRLGDVVLDAEQAGQGLRRPAAVRRPDLHPAASRHRRRRRPQRRRQVDAVPDDRRRGEAGRGRARSSARRSRSPTSTRAAAGLDPKKNVWELVSDGLDYIKVANFEVPQPRLRRVVRLQGPRSAEAGRRAVRW